jgi:hypothetical protein
MHLHLEVPDDVARQFAADSHQLGRLALEALAAEGVRTGKLSVYQASLMLGIGSQYEMDGLLKAHNVMLPDTLEDVVADRETALKFSR